MIPLPKAPPVLPGAAPASRLPAAPPRKRPSLFDKDHRQETLLAIAAGMGNGLNFSDGLGAAAASLSGLSRNLRQEGQKSREFGGPDNAFEITTDPTTGERTIVPVAAFQEHLADKREKPKDVADINGRAMRSIADLPEKDQPAAYAAMLQHPEFYGIDPRRMPETYDAGYVRNAANMGQTVAQATAAQQRTANAAATADYRGVVAADRRERTGIYRARSEAATGQGAERIAISRSKGGPKGKGKGKGRAKKPSGNEDLSYLQ